MSVEPHRSGDPEVGSKDRFCQIDGERFTSVERCEDLKPFLVNVVSDDDYWMFVGSNGSITAGRRNPDDALFPYGNQDTLLDSAGSTGSLTVLRVRSDGDAPFQVWEPWSASFDGGPGSQRRLFKNITGSRIVFEETEPELGLRWRHDWSFSARHGIVRFCELLNTGDGPLEIQLLDGLQNILPDGIDEAFQSRYSVLGDAYKSNELLMPAGLGVYSLSSLPTDRAEPNESLRATVVWSTGLEAQKRLLSTEQVKAFRAGQAVTGETAVRGVRGAYLVETNTTLSPGERMSWWTVADVGLAATELVDLIDWMKTTRDPASELRSAVRTTRDGLRKRVGTVDGIQSTGDELRCWRHFSNAMFNVMRGGLFEYGYSLPRDDFLCRLQHFNADAYRNNVDRLRALPNEVDRGRLIDEAVHSADPDLRRLASEYLPLSFSRRHGDPSRPWNRFSIDVRNADGSSRLAYQGNWRDIFQNWEALVYSYPEFIEATIFRFLNASTADGYNPYRVTDRGIEWEVQSEDDPWGNIGYWGDHQIVYLLKLLEASRRFQPDRLPSQLDGTFLVYTRVPYRIRPYEEILKDPRATIDFDWEAAAKIEQLVQTCGEDGKLLRLPDGEICRVSLIEKLLVPLLAKLSNFVPGGGIWMNTQRPEWNDANNALVGYGVSVVTLGYLYRYVSFLIELLEDPQVNPAHAVSVEVAAWMDAQSEVFASTGGEEDDRPTDRRKWLDRVGARAAEYRADLYENGLSGDRRAVTSTAVISFLKSVAPVIRATLIRNGRGDGLFHSYNLLSFEPDGGVGLGRLGQMLEGQVSILSSGVLELDDAATLLDALRRSPLYRDDQDSYLLYPDRSLPTFLEKNCVSAEAVERSELLQSLLDAGDTSIASRDRNGVVRFNAEFHNISDLRLALDELEQKDHGATQVATGRRTVEVVYEATFRHQAFTGRSGTFFAYEGLGSVYWHMVSKLLLAIQENHRRALDSGSAPELVERLSAQYHACLNGLGIHRSPSEYGAFPTDAYSHTPAHAGAQQPGMTGQVKEDLLTRLGELGLIVIEGCVIFAPRLLRRTELHAEPAVLEVLDLDGAPQTYQLPAQSLGFTFCQVPVIYETGDGPALELIHADGRTTVRETARLTREESSAVFGRKGKLRQIIVRLSSNSLTG